MLAHHGVLIFEVPDYPRQSTKGKHEAIKHALLMHLCMCWQVHGDQGQLLWSHPMVEQLQQQLGAASVQLLDAALVPPSRGGPPCQVAVLAASVPSDGGDGQVRACAASTLMGSPLVGTL